MKDFPGSEPYHSAEPKTRVARPQILEPRPQSPDICDDDMEFRANLWPQPSDSQQYFCAPAPVSPSSRPRSPWGKLDPYDSSEVETPALPLPLSGWVLKGRGRARKRAWGRRVGMCIKCFRRTFLFCIRPGSGVSALKALETQSSSRDRRPVQRPQMGPR